jgi:hypothetical protein
LALTLLMCMRVLVMLLALSLLLALVVSCTEGCLLAPLLQAARPAAPPVPPGSRQQPKLPCRPLNHHLLHGGATSVLEPEATGPPVPPGERPLLPLLDSVVCFGWASLHALMHGTALGRQPVDVWVTHEAEGVLVVRGCGSGWLRCVLHPCNDPL